MMVDIVDSFQQPAGNNKIEINTWLLMENASLVHNS